MVQELIDEVKRSVTAGQYYLALFGALTLPSICGALEASDGEDTKSRYIDWFDKWVSPRYMGYGGGQVITGEQCYSFRCAMLHQGRAIHSGLGYSRVIFLEPGKTGIYAHKNFLNGALNLDLPTFCRDMTEGAEAWLKTVQGTEPFKTNLKASFQRYPTGLAPYIVGAPVLS